MSTILCPLARQTLQSQTTRLARTAIRAPAAVSSMQISVRTIVSAEKLKKLATEPSADREHENLVIPVPKGGRDVFEAEAASGVPSEVSRRSVRIYKPARNAMQQGSANTDQWRLDFDVQERWENPLMGWASSHDSTQGLNIKFRSKEDAILFAERQGYDYWIDQPKTEKFRLKVYADNYKYVPGKLRIIKTK
ncbi:ETC complex I subunit conserved region-domain-containing protein [Phlyctochytrium arcticum]|nr:ETC complex I subunit conserved region-domain-containing protein [Phlyctochytrium arcticum]